MSGEMRELRCLLPTVEGSRIEVAYAAFPVGADEPTLVFREHIELPEPIIVDDTVRGLARLLSMAASLSYYKALVPALLTTEFEASEGEQRFFEAVTANGLAEFAYRNDLPQALTPTFAFGLGESVESAMAAGRQAQPGATLAAVGGGKDSIVTIEALRGVGRQLRLFSVNDYAPIAATAERAGLPRLMVTRKLDPQLFALNEAGAPNGHVPVTAINSVIALLVAYQQGIGEVVFSNEASSSYGNLTWHGRVVNHQWSKGIVFEQMLHDLVAPYGLTYVSLLRPLSELAIMRRFAQHAAYHDVFTSCNRAFKLDASKRTAWCGDCDKCRFVYLCLAPFVTRPQLEGIFGADLLADESQREGFFELLNIDDRVKPFECVGEPSECRVALDLIRESPAWAEHPFFDLPEIKRTHATASDHEFAFAWRTEHLLDGDLEKAARAIL